MRFDSLSDAIKFYAQQRDPLTNAVPYGLLAMETILPPQNINAVKPEGDDGIVYGQSIWGTGKITSISKPTL